jgi:cobalt-zinc-cadmium efflux system outer membrane protein
MRVKKGWLLAASLTLVASQATGEQPAGAGAVRSLAEPFQPQPGMQLAALERLVSDRSSAVESAVLDLALASAEVRQSRLLSNPTVDAAWNTVPIGATNPPGLSRPLSNVPSYEVGLSYTVELGKRSPRIERAIAREQAARHFVRASSRGQALALAHELGELATSALKLQGLRGILESGQRLMELARHRLATGFGTPLDADRLLIDVSRTEQLLREEEARQAASLAGCSAYLGRTCLPFAGPDAAREFLAGWFAWAERTSGEPGRRSDVLALNALARAATAEGELARAQAIPDPTLRLGYVRDQFVTAGAQHHSLNVSLSVPLPILDHGQAQSQAALAKRESYVKQKMLVLQSAEVRLPLLRERLAKSVQRQSAISSDIMPRARGVLTDVERAAELRLISVGDVVQARRTVAELLLEEANTYADAFDAALDIAGQVPESPDEQGSAPARKAPQQP